MPLNNTKNTTTKMTYVISDIRHPHYTACSNDSYADCNINSVMHYSDVGTKLQGKNADYRKYRKDKVSK